MPALIFVLCLISSVSRAQYEDYDSYETFSELDRFERDFGLMMTPSFMYLDVNEDNDVTNVTVNDRIRGLLFYDIRLGYGFHSGFYFGILYSGETQNVENSATSSLQNSRESIGLTVGYIKRGWALTASFLPYSKKTASTEVTDIAVYSEGMGFQLDAAYYFRLGRFVSVGPQLTFRSIQYRKGEQAANQVNSDANSQHTIFTPMISMIFNLYRD
jgi:hypothetical protein